MVMTEILSRIKSYKTVAWSADGVGPHAFTTRATATITSGRHAVIDTIYVNILRTAAPTTSGWMGAGVTVQLPGGSDLWQYQSQRYGGAVGDYIEACIPINRAVPGGTVIRLYTWDTNTGGTSYYSMLASYYEY